MKKKQPIPETKFAFQHDADFFSLGPAYLDYCVRKGWLEKTGDGPTASYEITEKGKIKLGDVQLNFDLSSIESKGDGPKKKRRRHKK
jgi:DNA-binding PadR family transcriptional regulator